MPQNLQQNQVNSYGYVPPNILINGGLEIWQRGAGPFTPSLAFSADEWMLTVAPGGTLSVTREAVVKNTGVYSLKAVQAVFPNSGLSQGIEGYKSFEGMTLTFSCWVNTTDTNTFVFLSDYDGSVVNAISSPHSGSGQWERLTVVKTIRTGLTTVASFPHSFGMRVGVTSGNAAATYYIDGATLVVGNFPEGVPFVPANTAEDMQRCERFYETGVLLWQGYSSSAWEPSYSWSYHTKKYAIPTATNSVWDGLQLGLHSVDPWDLNTIRARATSSPLNTWFRFYASWTAEVS
jgi:hypothetical protein